MPAPGWTATTSGDDVTRGHRHQILRAVGELGVQRRIDRDAARARDQQRVAVGRCLRDEVGGQAAARAGPVLDDHALAEQAAERIGNRARDVVGGTARCKSDDEADRLGRPALRHRAARAAEQAADRDSESTRGASEVRRVGCADASRLRSSARQARIQPAILRTILPTCSFDFHARLRGRAARRTRTRDRPAAGCGRRRSTAASRRRTPARRRRADRRCASCWRRRTASAASHAAPAGRSRPAACGRRSPRSRAVPRTPSSARIRRTRCRRPC